MAQRTEACAYYARKFTYYSFENFPKFCPIILLSLAYYSQVILRRYTGFRSTSFKIAELNPLHWLQILNKVRYDCSIRVPECSIRVYQSIIAIIIV